MVHPDNQLLGFLAYSSVDALRAIELQRGEFLLVFQTLGIYVDSQGRKSRDKEIMYPAIPLAVSCLDGHLLVYSETHIDVFNAASGDWIQTINVKKAKPLNNSGSLSICVINDLAYIVYLSNVHQSKCLTSGNELALLRKLIFYNFFVVEDAVNVTCLDSSGRQAPIRPRRRFSIREGHRTART